ncbi:MAG: hypothetical protein KF912_11140 [Phycisphaeraceae bacterium]|nr:hypothetical protein [Phycisphaeraceae bacterium]MBX3367854.1 hypothetical protein [Phycisphaeraceae bacterium]
MGRLSSQSGGLLGRLEALARADSKAWLHMASVVGMFVIGGALGLAALIALGKIEGIAVGKLATKPPALAFEWPRIEGGSTEATWMPSALRQDLEALAIGQIALDDPLSGASLARIGSALSRTGWFEGAPTLRRSFRGEQPIISISGTWRTPVAVVRYDGLDYLVGSGGVLLPARYSPGTSGMPLVVGVSEPPPTREGTGALGFGAPWPGREVADGLELLRLSSMMPFSSQIAAVDVARHRESNQLEFITDRGTRVLWGGAPSRPLPGEIQTEAKVALLLDIVRRFGRVDAGQNRIEIFSDRVVIDRTASAIATAPPS